MKKVILMGLAMALMGLQCDKEIAGSGVLVTENRPIPLFNHIKISGLAAVKIEHGPEYTLTVTADDNLIRELTSEISGDTIVINFDANADRFQNVHLEVEIEAPFIESIFSASTGSVALSGYNNLTDLNIEHAGIGMIEIEGSSRNLTIKQNHVGKISAFEFSSDSCTIIHDGIGNVEVSVEQSLNGKLLAVGDILYKGMPNINVEVIGLGKLIDAN